MPKPLFIEDRRFGNTDPVRLEFARYENGNLALQSFTTIDPIEPWARYSVNPPTLILEDNMIAIKDWSENEGVPEVLVRAGLIHPVPVYGEPSGHVWIDVYELTDKAKEYLPPKEGRC